jgi:LPXTG-motif cell wall-anchored protein
MAPEGLALPSLWGYIIGGVCTMLGLVWFILWKKQMKY